MSTLRNLRSPSFAVALAALVVALGPQRLTLLPVALALVVTDRIRSARPRFAAPLDPARRRLRELR